MWGAWGDAINNWNWVQYLFGTLLNRTYNSILWTNIW